MIDRVLKYAGSALLIVAILTFASSHSWATGMARKDEWVIVDGFGKSKTMIRESEIERTGSLVRVPVRYVLDPPGTDKRNGQAVAEMVMLEEYDLDESTFRVYRIYFLYAAGGSSQLIVEPQWKPATAGNERTLLYLRRVTQAVK
jgi:hypothetical protein